MHLSPIAKSRHTGLSGGYSLARNGRLQGQAARWVTPTMTAREPTRPWSDSRTGYRPTYIELGVDAEGRSHVYRTSDETVHVIADGERVHVEALDGRHVDEWMAYVAERVGWTREVYGVGIAEMAARALERRGAELRTDGEVA